MRKQTECANENEGAGTAVFVYGLYLISLVFGITAIIGLIVAYVNKSNSPEWLQSHFQFQIRTFWLGLLFFMIGLITLVIYIGWLIWPLLPIWWIVRCVKGIKYANDGIPHPDPESWGFG